MSTMRTAEIALDEIDQVILDTITSFEEIPNAQTLYVATEKAIIEKGRTLSRPWFNKHIRSLVDEGVVTFEDIGTEKFYSLVDGVDVREGVARVPAPITEDMGMKLRDTLGMFRVRGKLHQNICKMFNENPQYQSPDGLNWLLNAFKIEPNTARIISQHVFSAYQAQFAPGRLGPMAPYQAPMPGLPRFTGQPYQPTQYQPTQPQVISTPGGPQIVTVPVQTPGGPSTPIVVVSPPPPAKTQGQSGTIEHRVTERLAERTIMKYKIDEKGNPVLDDRGQPVVVEVVKEPIVIGGGATGQQIGPKDLLDVASKLVDMKTSGAPTQPPVDEEKIILKAKEVIKDEFESKIDSLKSYIGGTNASVEKLATTMNQYFAIQSAVKPYEARIKELTEGKGLSESQFKMQTQERLIKYVAEKLDTIPSTIRQFMGQQYVQTLAVLEQSYSMEPGTLIIPYIKQMAGSRPGEATLPTTSIAERRTMVEKIRDKVKA